MHWGKVGCACLLLPRFRQCSLDSRRERRFSETFKSRNTDPAGATRTDRLHISIVINLCFILRVTITIKGETQMGSVSKKGSTG